MKRKQSDASKRRSINLGIASRAAKIFRQHFENCLPFPTDHTMQCNLNGAIINWLGNNDADNLPPEENLGYINGFAFNTKASVAALWKLPITVTKQNEHLLQLHIPAFVPVQTFLPPKGTGSVTCKMAAASYNWNNTNLQNSAFETLSIPFNNLLIPAQDIPLAVPASPGCLLLTIVSLEFLNSSGQKYTRTRYLPCNVVDARYC